MAPHLPETECRHRSRAGLRFLTVSGLLALSIWELNFIAWVGDDAAITLRTVLNFIHGQGPVFNVGERVQAFTHPLWFLLLSVGAYVHPSVIDVVIMLSMALSLLSMFLFSTYVCQSWRSAIVLGCILLTSKSYADFSASGLENPLCTTLLITFFLVARTSLKHHSERSVILLGFIASLLYLTRADLIVLIAPLTMYVLYAGHFSARKYFRIMALSSSPALLWTIFSIIYYGFPVPNTAFAKLGTGVGALESLAQGFKYFKQSFSVDPVTLLTISSGIIIGLFSSIPARSLALGAVLYCVYILRIGGDFMSGRFFSAPLIVSLIAISLHQRYFKLVGPPLALCGLLNIDTALLRQKTIVDFQYGIADERRYYWPGRNYRYLLSHHRSPDYRRLWRTFDPQKLRRINSICGGLGYRGLESGPAVHIVDSCGLADPLLARLPSRPNQRVGHWLRNVPTNYLISIVANQNHLIDDDVKDLYDKIRIVTRGDLFTWERWLAIYELNFGTTPNLSRWKTIYQKPYSDDASLSISIAQLPSDVQSFGSSLEIGSMIFGQELGPRVEIFLPERQLIEFIDIALDNNDRYRIEAFTENSFEPLFEFGPRDSQDSQPFIVAPDKPVNRALSNMVRYRRSLDGEKPVTNRIRVVALDGDGRFAIRHLKIN